MSAPCIHSARIYTAEGGHNIDTQSFQSFIYSKVILLSIHNEERNKSHLTVRLGFQLRCIENKLRIKVKEAVVKWPHSPLGLRHSFSQSESTVASFYRNCHWPKKIISPKFMLLARDSLYPITGPCKVTKPGLFASIWEISEGSLQLQHPSTIM